MKKNLLAVVICALVIVNVVLTAIIMFSTVSANKRTVALVNDIATVLDLELSDPTGEVVQTSSVPIGDTDVYSIPDAMTIALRPSADGSEHYCMCQISLAMNKSDSDYETYQPMVAAQESKIRSIIIGVIGSYTKEDAQNAQSKIQDEILAQVQGLFSSRFIYEVYFSDIKFQ